jgi:hypothetical protein
VRVREQDLQGATGQQGLGEGPGGGAPVPRATRILKQNVDRQANTLCFKKKGGWLLLSKTETPSHSSTHS